MDRGDTILIDGGTGTEVECREVPQLENSWNSGGTISHPDIVRQVHEHYIASGAEIVISNSFGSAKHALEDAGLADQFDSMNRSAVELAVQARRNQGTPHVLVAAGMSYWSWTENKPSAEEIGNSAREQASIMMDAGANLIMLEMMVDIDRMSAMVEATSATGLPVWVGLSCQSDDNGVICLLNGETLADAVESLKSYDVPLINIMHTHIEFIDDALDVLSNSWSGYKGVYAHTGKFESDDSRWIQGTAISAEEYCENAQRWLDSGIQLIGGCCGIGVGHISELNSLLDSR